MLVGWADSIGISYFSDIFYFMKLAAAKAGVGAREAAGSVIALLVFILAGCLCLHGEDSPLRELRTAEQIRQLTPEQAARRYPVRLRGVVTFFDQAHYFRFMQDDTAGIYFFLGDAPDNPPLAAGQLVELEGEVSAGEFAPIVTPSRIQILGAGTFPATKPATFEQLASGQEDSQFVEVHGIVRAVD